jgi:hypothetical protein
MSKIGLVRDSVGVNKPIQLELINNIIVTTSSIQIYYQPGSGFSNDTTVVILLENPTLVGQAFLRERVLKWIGEGINSSSALYLNDYLSGVIPVSVGVRGTTSFGSIIAAADSAAACIAIPSTQVLLNYQGGGAPPIGAGIYLADPSATSRPFGPVAAGTYALSIGFAQYFITVNSASNISFIQVCPLALDYVFNLQNLGTGPVTGADLDGISFTLNSFFVNGYNSYVGFTGNPNSNPGSFNACNPTDNASVYGPDNSMWPIGDINNAGKDFSAFDVSFAIALNDSNSADWNQADIYISFDLNAKAGVVADATFVPFTTPFGANPVFASSPTTGIPGLGDGTVLITPTNGQPDAFAFFFSDFMFIPAVGQSLIGTANFTNGTWVAWNRNNGRIDFVQNPTCNP